MLDAKDHELMTISQIAHMMKNISMKKMWLPFLQNIFVPFHQILNEIVYSGATDIGI